MGGKVEPEGPEKSLSFALQNNIERKTYAGQAGGEAVLLVRRGEEVFAVGASCSHYGAPLADGIVVDGTIRCPWHHACFSLRTGEAVGPPALKPIATWEVEVRDGVVRLGAKSKAATLADFGRKAEGPGSVVIVGAGAAGSAAAEMLRREGYGGPVTLVDPDGDAPYDRPNLSKEYLSGEAPESWIPLRPAGFYAEHGIDRVVAGVDAIDTAASTVTLTDGRVLPYGALLLATGSTPSRLTVPGADLGHVHVLRSLSDCRAIIQGAAQGKRAVVIGASFIGMEVAAALRARSLEVTVVAPDAVPFARTLGDALGGHLREVHEKKGVRFRLGRTAQAILEDRVRLDDQSEVPADLVVVGVGVRPDVRLAEAAGIRVDDGVVVDRFLQTSAPRVFAAGDIARWPDARSGTPIRVEHWVVAQRQGQAAARNILGRRVPFTDVPFFWTGQYGTTVAYVGHAREWDRVEVEGDVAAEDCAVSYRRGETLLALATLGRDRESLRAEEAMRVADTGASLPSGGL
jgi:3-phenylpropionate/trans-cinnamate dioxygenase ferredoxin reductase subunit